jgi:hypothetical protein
MKFARKLILHSPVSDEGLLDPFVEQCLRDGVSLLAIAGPGSSRLEDIVDEIVVGDGSDPNRSLCTTAHPDEPLEDVLNMAKAWDAGSGDRVEEMRL